MAEMFTDAPPVVTKDVTPVVPVVTPEVKVETPAPKEPAVKPEGDGTLLGETPKTPEETAAAEAAAATAKAAEDAKKAELLKNETPDQKAEREAKEKADADAKSKVVPDKYEPKLPDGLTLDPVAMGKLTPVLKELGITQGGFQKILDVYAPLIKEQTSTQLVKQQTEAIQAWKDNVKAWGEETKAAYGQKLGAEMAYAAKAINKFSSNPSALRELLNDKPGTTGTGLGNNKLIVEMFIKAGRLIGEDTFPRGNPPPGNKAQETDEGKASQMFPNNAPG